MIKVNMYDKINLMKNMMVEKNIDLPGFDFQCVQTLGKDNKNILIADILNKFYIHVSPECNRALFMVYGVDTQIKKREYQKDNPGEFFIKQSLSNFYEISKREIHDFHGIIKRILGKRDILFDFFNKHGASVWLMKRYNFEVDKKFIYKPTTSLKKWL